MNQPTGQRTPRLKHHHQGYDLREHILPLGSEDYSEYQIVDEAPSGESFSGDDITILLSIRDVPAEVVNGMIRLITPGSLERGEFYTLRQTNDYRFDFTACRWLPVSDPGAGD